MVALNEWLTFFNVRVNQINLITGREALLKIKPTQHTASDNTKALSIKSRQCRFMTENHVIQIEGATHCSRQVDLLQLGILQIQNSMFTIYKQKGCLFECKVRYVANKTGCTPWDFPVPEELSALRFCNGDDLFKFNQLLDNPI